MKRFLNSRMSLALLLVLAPLGLRADTIFTDNFSNGSTTNELSIPGGTTNASFTSYDLASSKPTSDSSIGPNLFVGKINDPTSSGYWEAQVLFTTNPVVLTKPGDYVDLSIVFTNSAGTIIYNGTSTTGGKSALWLGLYDSGAAAGTTNPPLPGNLSDSGLNTTPDSPYATGNCQLWQGYVGDIRSGDSSQIYTRPVQDPNIGTASANQELLGRGVSSGTYGKGGSSGPSGTVLASTTQTVTLATNTPYTLQLRITLDPDGAGDLILSNALYSGVGTGGTLVASNAGTDSAPLALSFDGMAFGLFNSSSPSANPQMDVSSITVTGHSSPITTPPSITSQPVSATAPVGALVPFTVGASGFNMTYQWHRNGTNLVNGGNISGANSATLLISPVTAADASSSYSVTVTGAGGYTTNSATASLTIGTATSLVWSGNSGTWDLGTTADWYNPSGGLTTFNYGDPVTFTNTSGSTAVTLSNSYLSAGSVTFRDIPISVAYTLEGSGSMAGPGSLIDAAAGEIQINNANTYTGGTVISNAEAYLRLNNNNGLGTGPITLAKAGGIMEVGQSGGKSSGLQGNIVVADDFEIYFDGFGSYAGVMFGNLSGTAGKTLTLQPGNVLTTTTNRYRVYGADTVYNANLVLNGPAVANGNYSGTALAPYNNSGSQTYNGVISGNGGLVQRGGGTTILNGANTYAGGTTPTTGAIGIGNSSALGSGPLYLAPEVPDATGSGMIFASGGARTISNPIEYPSGTNNLTLIIGGANNLTLAGPFSLNGNDGTTTYTNRTIEVTNTGLTTISGVISGTGFNLTETGNGTLALTSAETYTGTTTLGGGRLLVNGSLGAGDVIVTNGLLGGSGTIAGAVTVMGGGLEPANLFFGPLTINNSLTLQSNSFNLFEVNETSVTNDRVNVSGTVTYGGTLNVLNLSGTVTTNDSFKIFSAGSETGNFSTISGSPGSGLAWSFDPTNGVLSVIGAATVATNPTNIMVTVVTNLSGGKNLQLSWPQSHKGWTLQTNAVGLASTTNWFNYPGSASVTNESFPIDLTKTNVFYRLIYNP